MTFYEHCSLSKNVAVLVVQNHHRHLENVGNYNRHLMIFELQVYFHIEVLLPCRLLGDYVKGRAHIALIEKPTGKPYEQTKLIS